MSRTRKKIEFVLDGLVAGEKITPETIGLGRFNAFNVDVAKFVAGSDEIDLNEIRVKVEDGSHKLVLIGVSFTASLLGDLRLLERHDALGEIDPKRAAIVAKWQEASRAEPEISYGIRSVGLGIKPIRVSRSTDYHYGDAAPWVKVEKYLFGEVLDIGGVKKANVHVRLDGSGDVVRIGTNQGYLREQESNRLYRKVLVRVEAEQHSVTGEMRNYRLLSFEDYDPHYDEAALDQFAAVGRVAWKDVPDHVAWVRALRGGD
jgi:hypothetical protein